ncbi:hypothetical protein KCH_76700 [Kitasatospora cheerisanensis KCTC 2395]|uniref:Uncharacterized protein n=1 Tax=Kitasatospora cheerisanensis KCTC 2395 TaxID=1348663 RepID=A0A066YG96_9ACTN|nr:hypothetical protein KCH_76700 [Kitasatospora cheerisanensis KCTC 2395]
MKDAGGCPARARAAPDRQDRLAIGQGRVSEDTCPPRPPASARTPCRALRAPFPPPAPLRPCRSRTAALPAPLRPAAPVPMVVPMAVPTVVPMALPLLGARPPRPPRSKGWRSTPRRSGIPLCGLLLVVGGGGAGRDRRRCAGCSSAPAAGRRRRPGRHRARVLDGPAVAGPVEAAVVVPT